MKRNQFIERKRNQISREELPSEEELTEENTDDIDSITEEYNEINQKYKNKKSEKEKVEKKKPEKQTFKKEKPKRNSPEEKPKDSPLQKEQKSNIQPKTQGTKIDHLYSIIYDLKKEKNSILKYIYYLKDENENLKKEMKDLKNENSLLKLQTKRDEENIDELFYDVDALRSEVKELSRFVFKAKLRKLLKKLLEYILKNYFNSYMIYNGRDKRVSFKKAPEILKIYGESEDDSKAALNEILYIIFHYSKIIDYTLHFANKDAIEKKAIKKNIVVFQKYEDFFDYFKISEKNAKILIKVIPKEYFMNINDAGFDEKLSTLLYKYCK